MEPFDHGLLGPVRLFDSPASVVHVGQCPDVKASAVVQGGRQSELRVACDVSDKADAERPAPERWRVPGRCDGHGPVGLARGDEGVEHRVGGLLDAEDEVQPALRVGQRDGKRPGAPVIQNDIALGGAVRMRERGLPLVLVVEQVEVARDAVAQPATRKPFSASPPGRVIFDPSTARTLRPFQGGIRGRWRGSRGAGA